MNNNTYYKVVVRNPDTYEVTFNSAVMNDPRYRVVYKLNEWTRPTVGKLFVFTDLYSARLFCTDITRKTKYRVFKCECENPTFPDFERVLYLCETSYFNNDTIEKFWKSRQISSGWIVSLTTMVCDAVKLTEEIPLDKFYQPT